MRYQPQGLQRINRRSPLTQGLIQAFPGYGRADSANGKLYSTIGSPKQAAGGWEITTTNASLYRTALVQEKTNAFTVAILVRSLGNSSAFAAISGITYDNAGNSPYGDQIDRGSDGASLRFACNVGGSAIATGQFGNLVVGVDEWLFATFTSGAQALYRQNGGLVGTSTGNGSPSYTATSQVIIGPSTNDGRNPNVIVKASLRWNRVLSQTEMNAVMANPWQLFEAPDEDDFLVASTGPTYTLGASSGAYALTGAAATVSARRRLAAAAAGFALTPLAAALKANRKLAGASGPLAMTALSARLVAARRLPAEPGAWALSASMGRLTAARKLTAAPGAFALTGGTATFVYTPKSGGQGPTYTLTGGSGAFLMTVNTARLLLARRMVTAAGAFSATGMSAALAAARRLQAAPASFALAGRTTDLRAGRRLAAGFGLFSTSGVAAKIAASRRLPATTGSFAVGGTDALMKYSANRGEIDIDASAIPANRTVVFGAFSRLVVFGASSRVVVFGGATRVVVFDDPKLEKENSMANAEEPYFVDGKWICDKDPDEKSYFVADISKELAKRHTTAVSVVVLTGGVTATEGPDIQGNLIVVKLEGMDVTDGAENFWTARVTCANTEQFDRTTWLNKVDN